VRFGDLPVVLLAAIGLLAGWILAGRRAPARRVSAGATE